MTTTADNSLREAAAFVRSLAPDAAATLLARLSAEEANRLRRAVAEFTDESSLREAGSVSETPAPKHGDTGVELELSAQADAERTVAQRPTPAPATPTPTPKRTPVDEADPTVIADYLRGAQPAAVAVLLGRLKPQAAAAVLQEFPADQQADLLESLAAADDADPHAVDLLEADLAEWVSRCEAEAQRRATRVAAVHDILAASPESARRQLRERLGDLAPASATSADDAAPMAAQAETKTPTPATPVEAPPAPLSVAAWDEVLRVDGPALAAAVARLDTRTALLGLAAAPTEVVDRLASQWPRSVARDLRKRLNQIGPTTLAEIDRAQAQLAEAVGVVWASRGDSRRSTRWPR